VVGLTACQLSLPIQQNLLSSSKEACRVLFVLQLAVLELLQNSCPTISKLVAM